MIAEIRGIGSFVPEKIITNEELAQTVDTTDGWIREHTGIEKRRIIAPGEAASDMAIRAARMALERAQVGPEELDLIITATATPDYSNFPATACLIQHELGAEHSGAFDLAAGCTGFIYGLSVARGMILAGDYRNILVVGTEALSRITNWQDRNTCVLFGDGAGAAVVSANNNQDNRGILQTMLRSEGAGGEHLMRRAGGSRMPFTPGMDPAETFISMNGRRVYGFAVRVCTILINSLLRKANLHLRDIKHIVPHQANERIIQAAAERLSISLDKFYLNIAEYANTSSASIPIALREMEEKDLLHKGDLILTLAFGAGLTYGGLLIRW
ncbi:MAG: ketoacyl-ACP synthase III [Spirochaetales bacterium]|jgi:3-oxoacyl-[acyl-carrier-protein] synthase-3|nr:ketoacyl-ACP synthase III [Spirochaetales bacterium]